MICRKCKAEIPDISAFCLKCGTKQAVSTRNPKRRGNGQGSVFKLPSGKYRAEVTLFFRKDGSGKLQRKRVTKTYSKRADAILGIAELQARVYVVKPDKMTLHELHEIYTSSKEYEALSSSQRDKLRFAWTRLEPIEYRDITTLTVDDMQRVIEGAVKTYYPARDMKVMLSHLYSIAIKKELVQYNKTEYIDLPASPTAKRDRWTDEELATFWKDYDEHEFTGYILIMCYAGLRYGELSTMQIENVDLKSQVMIGGIKTEAGIDREIPIADKILPIIDHFCAKGKYKMLEMSEDNFYATYWKTVERLGVRHLPPNTCRHTYFSLMTAAGIQAGIITETGGHTSYMTTMQNYVRLSLAEKLNAVNQI